MSDVKWKLVPVEPTEAMMDAAIATVEKPCFPQDIYAAMLAASPAAPPAEALQAGVEARHQALFEEALIGHFGTSNTTTYTAREAGRQAAIVVRDLFALLSSAPAQGDGSKDLVSHPRGSGPGPSSRETAAIKLADGYGIVLAMIAAGCSDPQRFAKRMLAEHEPEAKRLEITK